MKVTAVSTLRTPSNSRCKNNNTKYNAPTGINNTDLITPTALYNRISFKGKTPTKTLPELIEYMQKNVQPFLEDFDPTFNKICKLSTSMEEEARDFVAKKVVFKPEKFKEAKRLRLGELFNNIEEFSYLLNKSNPRNRLFSTDKTHEYACDLLESGMFEVPAFVKEPYNAYVKMVQDTNNGLKNITLENLHPDVAKKKLSIQQAATEANMGLGFFLKTHSAYKKFHKLLNEGKLDIETAQKLAQDAKNSIKKHKEILPDINIAISDAEQMSKTGMFIEYDYEMLQDVPKKTQQVISRNAKKFNDTASKTELDNNETQQLDAIIKYQKELIEDLWNKIETDKKAYRELRKKDEEAFSAEFAKKSKFYTNKFDDTLPF